MKKIACLISTILILLYLSGCHNYAADNEKLEISGAGWKIWLDTAAQWQDDRIYLPDDLNLAELASTPPTTGWEDLYRNKGVDCSIPGTAEEYFGTSNEWTYHGVIWYYKEVFIPENFRDRLNFIQVNSFRHRLEIYINEELAGYDIIALTPYTAEVSDYLVPGQMNRIAFRVTNPGGQRGWEDYLIEEWNGLLLPATYDYGGIGGNVHLWPDDSIYFSDLFIKNLLPAERNLAGVYYEVTNTTNGDADLFLQLKVIHKETGKTLLKEKFKQRVPSGTFGFERVIEVPRAKKWSPANPELYRCVISFSDAKERSDVYARNFGFRVFEMREGENGKNIYFNNKRIRIRSAIDWGQYAYNGLYPTPEMALKSVSAVKAVGHNMLSFHRRSGDPLLMDIADSLGVFLYEEPGGLHFESDSDTAFIVRYMREKIRRMIIRDRNHPGMLIYSLSNEDQGWSDWRRDYMKMINELDDTRLVVNSSGYAPVLTYHIKPYSKVIENDFIDEHTVGSATQFDEQIFHSHLPHGDSVYDFYGEVACYTGPPSVAELIDGAQEGRGFDLNLYSPLYEKIQELFYCCNMENYGSRHIHSPRDITRQVSRGLMYTNGRLGQVIMSHDEIDGYAINGWTDGPQTYDAWSSAMLDMGRNLKGPAEDIRYWNRPLQVAMFRNNGKYFNVGDTAEFRICIINEGVLKAGKYDLNITVKDGRGSQTEFSNSISVEIQGGDVFAQEVYRSFPVVMQPHWHAGHITIAGTLFSGGDTITSGTEQVLLQNRPSWHNELLGKKIAVVDWDAAEEALVESGIEIRPLDDTDLEIILAGNLNDTALVSGLIRRLEDRPIRLILRFDAKWADYLYSKRLLSEKVVAWGGYQSHDWNGNGWGYIDRYIGNQAVPSADIISTRSWEVPGDPYGFYPFKSFYEQEAYGVYLARTAYPEPKWGDLAGKGEFLSSVFTENNQLLVLMGRLEYGDGEIILAPSYPVDEDNPFNDLLFFKLITRS